MMKNNHNQEIFFCEYFSNNKDKSFYEFIEYAKGVKKTHLTYNNVRSTAERLKRKHILSCERTNSTNGYLASDKIIVSNWQSILLGNK